MGYSETGSWTLNSADVPAYAAGELLYFYVQTYRALGIGADGVEKARYLHDGDFNGSAWSSVFVLPKPTNSSTVDQIKKYLTAQNISFPDNATKAELLALVP